MSLFQFLGGRQLRGNKRTRMMRFVPQHILCGVRISRELHHVIRYVPQYILRGLFIFQHIGYSCVLYALLIGAPTLASETDEPLFQLQETAFSKLNFDIRVYSDGNVIYQGFKIYDTPRAKVEQHVYVVGTRKAKITREQLAELLATYEALPFDFVDEFNDRRGHVIGSTYIYFRRGQETAAFNIPPFFHVLTTKLNKLIDINKWICFPKGHPRHSECLIHDLPDNFKF